MNAPKLGCTSVDCSLPPTTPLGDKAPNTTGVAYSSGTPVGSVEPEIVTKALCGSEKEGWTYASDPGANVITDVKDHGMVYPL